MIYIFVGNDTKKKNLQIKKIVSERDFIKIQTQDISKGMILGYASSQNLFGDTPIIIIENFFTESDISLLKDDLNTLKDSETIFIFLEDKMLATEQKKYTKYATIESFEEKTIKQIPKINTFAIADSFARPDKITTWILYNEAMEAGIEPETISGILFWKIKTMILNGTKNFSAEELKNQSSNIVSIYHLAHRGELDFKIGIEQLILSSLNK